MILQAGFQQRLLISHSDVTKYDMIYYNPTTRLGLKGKLEDVGRDPSSGVAFRGIACSCEGPTCGCCAGINITAFKFDRRACTNFTYVPEDFAVNVTFMVNDRVLIRTGALSGNVAIEELFFSFPYNKFIHVIYVIINILFNVMNLQRRIPIRSACPSTFRSYLSACVSSTSTCPGRICTPAWISRRVW